MRSLLVPTAPCERTNMLKSVLLSLPLRRMIVHKVKNTWDLYNCFNYVVNVWSISDGYLTTFKCFNLIYLKLNNQNNKIIIKSFLKWFLLKWLHFFQSFTYLFVFWVLAIDIVIAGICSWLLPFTEPHSAEAFVIRYHMKLKWNGNWEKFTSAMMKGHTPIYIWVHRGALQYAINCAFMYVCVCTVSICVCVYMCQGIQAFWQLPPLSSQGGASLGAAVSPQMNKIWRAERGVSLLCCCNVHSAHL